MGKNNPTSWDAIKVPGDCLCSGISKRSGHLGDKILPIGGPQHQGSPDTCEIRESFSWRIMSPNILGHWLWVSGYRARLTRSFNRTRMCSSSSRRKKVQDHKLSRTKPNILISQNPRNPLSPISYPLRLASATATTGNKVDKTIL